MMQAPEEELTYRTLDMQEIQVSMIGNVRKSRLNRLIGTYIYVFQIVDVI